MYIQELNTGMKQSAVTFVLSLKTLLLFCYENVLHWTSACLGGCTCTASMCAYLSQYIPVRTLMAPCTALTSPLTSISISKVNNCGQASGQSQWAMADTAYATLERTLLMASRRPLGSSSLMAALAWRRGGQQQFDSIRLKTSSEQKTLLADITYILDKRNVLQDYLICSFRRPELF